MALAIRYSICLVFGLAAIVTGLIAVRQITEVLRLKREATRVTGLLRTWTTKGGFRAEVSLNPDDRDQTTWVAMSHESGVFPLRDVDVYIHPTDPSRSRVGGLLQFWLNPAVLILATVIFLVPAVWTLTLGEPPRYEDTLPADWVGRWVWFAPAPWPVQAEDLVLRLPSYYWIATLAMALMGTPFLYHGLFQRQAFWPGRLLWGIFGLAVTGGFGALSLYFGTYRQLADKNSAREASIMGWRQAPWSSVRRLEDEAVRERRWSSFSRRYEPGLTISGRNSLVLMDEGGRRLMSIGMYMEPPATRRKVWDLARRRTGLKPVDTERPAVQ